MCPCCPWFVLAPKVFQLCTNHLVWVLCKPTWVIEACQLLLVPSWSSSMPFYPLKCCEPGSVPRLLPLPLFSTWTHIWVLRRVGSASFVIPKYICGNKYIKKTIEMILSSWNLHYMLNIVIPYDWNKFVNHLKSLIIIISQMNIFGVRIVGMR
jgi:hypothetical protein